MKRWGVPFLFNLLLSIATLPGLPAQGENGKHCSLMLSELYASVVSKADLGVPGILQRLQDLSESRIRAVLEPLLGAEPVNQLLERRKWLLGQASLCGWTRK
jgi:hypothetical protein